MIIHNLKQGTPEWRAFRAKHLTASEAPAMMGVSRMKTRNELLTEKYTEMTKDVSWFTQKIFDKGHRFEALARPVAEQIVGQELSPVTGSKGRYSASFDGLTMMNDINFEHKQLNQELAALTSIDDLHIEYKVQMEHQHLVSDAEKTLFMASNWSNDGMLLNEVHFWYEPDLELRARIEQGWIQFEKDLLAYVPRETKEMPAAQVQIELPALFIQAAGAVTTSNMKEYGAALKEKLVEVRKIVLVTDQDFSDAKEAAKVFREQIIKNNLAKEAMLSQTVTIGEAARMIEAWNEDLRITALQLEKDVIRVDLAKKAGMLKEAKDGLIAHIQEVEKQISPIKVVFNQPDFNVAIKGKSKYDSMQAALDAMLAAEKVDIDLLAGEIANKYSWYMVSGMKHAELFPDLQVIIYKQEDDFKLLVQDRTNKAVEKQRQIEADNAAKKAAEEAAAAKEKPQAPPPEPNNVVELRPAPTEELSAAVVEHQDEVSGFLATLDVSDKTRQTVRAYIMEFVKYQTARATQKTA